MYTWYLLCLAIFIFALVYPDSIEPSSTIIPTKEIIYYFFLLSFFNLAASVCFGPGWGRAGGGGG